jgi:hypothetical protein
VKGKGRTLKSASGFGAHHDNTHFTNGNRQRGEQESWGQRNNKKRRGIEDRDKVMRPK